MTAQHPTPLAFVLAIAVSVPASANLLSLPDPFGLHAEQSGSARSLALFAPDFSAVLTNPAALAQSRGGQLSLGYLYAQPRLSVGSNKVNADPNNVALVGLKLNLRELTTLDRQITLGVALGLDQNFQGLLHLTDGPSLSGQFARYGRSQLLLVPGVGVEVTDWLRVGAAVNVAVSAGAQMDFRTTLGGNTDGESVVLTGGTQLAPILGAQIVPPQETPLAGWTFAMSYRASSWYELGVQANADAQVGSSTLASLPLNMTFIDAYRPHEVTLGARMERGKLRAGMGLDLAFWRPLGALIHARDTARSGSGLSFSNVVSPRVGAEYLLTDELAMRGGYAFEPSPLRDVGPTPLNVIDTHRHVASLGLGYLFSFRALLRQPLSADAAYVIHALVPRGVQLSAANGEAQSSIARGVVHAGHVTVTARF